MKQLTHNGTVLSIGDIIADEADVEGGTIVGIDYETEEVHVFDGKEGWTMCDDYDNMGGYTFENVDVDNNVSADSLSDNTIIQVVTVDDSKRLQLSKPQTIASFKRDMHIDNLGTYINNTHSLVQTVVHSVVYSVVS